MNKAPLLFKFMAKAMRPWGYVCLGDSFLRAPHMPEHVELVIEDWGGNRGWPSIASTSNSIQIVPRSVMRRLADLCGDSIEFCPVLMPPLEQNAPNGFVLEKLYAIRPVGRILLDEGKLGEDYQIKKSALAKPRAVPILTKEPFPKCALAKNARASWHICTIDMVLLARKQHWHEFGFTPLDVPRGVGTHYIEHTDKKWPPQWYPENFEADPSNLADVIPGDPLA